MKPADLKPGDYFRLGDVSPVRDPNVYRLVGISPIYRPSGVRGGKGTSAENLFGYDVKVTTEAGTEKVLTLGTWVDLDLILKDI